MKTVAIVQARMTSTRLPGKVLADLGGAPVIARVIERLRSARRIDDVVVACTDRSTDDPLAAWAARAGVRLFRGSEHDVLGRFVGAAREAGADAVVRVTADCPLIDAEVVDRVVGELVDHPAESDYASNVERRSFPRGLDVEALFMDTLLRADRLGISPEAREHVTVVIRSERPNLFLARHVVAARDDRDLRWTVDTPEDLAFVRRLFEETDLTSAGGRYLNLVAWCRAHPELSRTDEANHTWDPSRARAGGING